MCLQVLDVMRLSDVYAIHMQEDKSCDITNLESALENGQKYAPRNRQSMTCTEWKNIAISAVRAVWCTDVKQYLPDQDSTCRDKPIIQNNSVLYSRKSVSKSVPETWCYPEQKSKQLNQRCDRQRGRFLADWNQLQDYMRAKYDQLPRKWLYDRFLQHFSKWRLNQQICGAVSYAVLLYRGEPPTTRGQYRIDGTGLVNQATLEPFRRK